MKKKFHGMIREVDLLHSRIAELEDANSLMADEIVRLKEKVESGDCRFHCRKRKGRTGD